MKKVRNLLILLLAALMLTVVVSCAEPEPELPPKEIDKVGDLILSKVFLKSKTENFFAITNASDKAIDLSAYSFASYHSAEDTRVRALPNQTLAPGASIYCAVFDYESKSIAVTKLFPGLASLTELPHKGPYDEPIEKDMIWTGVSGGIYYKGSMELVKNVQEIGESSNADKDGNKFKIYSWETVDKIVIDGADPVSPVAAVRSYDATTKEDKGWTVVDPETTEGKNALDCPVQEKPVEPEVPADYSYATFKKNILDKLPAKPVDKVGPNYCNMSTEEMAAFVEAAKADQLVVTPITDPSGVLKQIHFETANGYTIKAQSWGGYYLSDFTWETFKTRVNGNDFSKMDAYVYYAFMPVAYVDTFKNSAKTEKNWTVDVNRETKTFQVEMEDMIIRQIDKDWSFESTVVADYSFDYFKKTILDKVPTDDASFDYSTLSNDVNYTLMNPEQLKAFQDALKVAYPEIGKDDAGRIYKGKFRACGLIQTDGMWSKANGPIMPDIDIYANEYDVTDKELYISFIYYDKSVNSRVVGITNASDHNVSLGDYELYLRTNLNEKVDVDKKTGDFKLDKNGNKIKKNNKGYDLLKVKVQVGTKPDGKPDNKYLKLTAELAPGKTLMVYSAAPNVNGFDAIPELDKSHTEATVITLNETHKMLASSLTFTGNDDIYLEKNKGTVKYTELVNCDDKGVEKNIDDPEYYSKDSEIKGCAQPNTFYLRDFDNLPKLTMWNRISTNDDLFPEYIEGLFKNL